MKTSVVFVEDLSGFNFVKNIHQEGTHIFECASGFFVCNSPQEDDSFKHQKVLREATEQEAMHHIDSMRS